MAITIKNLKKEPVDATIVVLFNEKTDLSTLEIEQAQIDYLNKKITTDEYGIATLNTYPKNIYFAYTKINNPKEAYKHIEKLRDLGNKLNKLLNSDLVEVATVLNKDDSWDRNEVYGFVEGLALSNYQFLKYKTKDAKFNSLKTLNVVSKNLKDNDISELNYVLAATELTKDLVNEPVNHLSAEQFSERIKALGREANFKVEVLNKAKIEALKMGGLLGVNQGSQNPPTFNIMEWKPKNAVNKKPLVLVGKGIMFDTGGINLKPSSGMETMKDDMAGGATVVGAIYAIAKNELPIYVVGLVPATDNKPDANAMVPSDIIYMSDGTSVEMLNTDAEGRLILADALVYAQKYKPELVIDLATLTGSAMNAIGKYATVMMGNADKKMKKDLMATGEEVYERLAELPFFEEYKDLLKSDIADIKSIGGATAGAITAGKFLEHFTAYDWIHLDIAGTAYYDAPDSYRSKYATAIGVRLLYHFAKKLISNHKS